MVHIFFLTALTIISKQKFDFIIISNVFYCFVNFFCISLFFYLLFLFIFSAKFVTNIFWSILMLKINKVQPLKVKIWISILINWKNTIYIGFVHKITFWSNFWVDKFFSKRRGFKTVYAGVTNLVLKVARHLKEKSREMSRREHFALRNNRAKRWGGAKMAPPQWD